MNEAETRAELIDPALKEAGWSVVDGSRLVLRTANRGANAGNQFWGCSTYPKCSVMQIATLS